jgi:hypothetical protein
MSLTLSESKGLSYMDRKLPKEEFGIIKIGISATAQSPSFVIPL